MTISLKTSNMSEILKAGTIEFHMSGQEMDLKCSFCFPFQNLEFTGCMYFFHIIVTLHLTFDSKRPHLKLTEC